MKTTKDKALLLALVLAVGTPLQASALTFDEAVGGLAAGDKTVLSYTRGAVRSIIASCFAPKAQVLMAKPWDEILVAKAYVMLKATPDAYAALESHEAALVFNVLIVDMLKVEGHQSEKC